MQAWNKVDELPYGILIILLHEHKAYKAIAWPVHKQQQCWVWQQQSISRHCNAGLYLYLQQDCTERRHGTKHPAETCHLGHSSNQTAG